MERHVFRMDKIGTLMGSIILISLSGFMVYNLIATRNYLNLILIILPLLFFIPIYRRRIILEEGVLYYKRTKVTLRDISKITTDRVSEASGFGGVLVLHLLLLDKEGNTLVHFDKSYVRGKKLDRFIKLVKADNPGVEINI